MLLAIYDKRGILSAFGIAQSESNPFIQVTQYGLEYYNPEPPESITTKGDSPIEPNKIE